MFDRIIEELSRIQRDYDAAMQSQADAVGARATSMMANGRQRVAQVSVAARWRVACLAAGLGVTWVSLSVPAIESFGSGYFVRAGILLTGLALTSFLRPLD